MDSDTLALWALIGTGLSLIVAMVALIVAVLDWHQVGREEPWSLTKVRDNIWVLERVHRSPVTITALLHFEGGPVDVLNNAGFPVGIFRRGTKETLRITPAIGTSLTVFYRRIPRWKMVARKMAKKSAPLSPAWPSHEGMRDAHIWSTPIY